LNRLTLLLHFVEYLEKLIYTAYEGLAVGQQLTSKPVKIFFRTNKSTCNEWFWRVRYFIVNICCKSGHYELAVRQSYEYIQHCVNHNLTTVIFFFIVRKDEVKVKLTGKLTLKN
jgi:PI-3-kinase-related kinase SMG-1